MRLPVVAALIMLTAVARTARADEPAPRYGLGLAEDVPSPRLGIPGLDALGVYDVSKLLAYDKATEEDSEIVLNKLFPKKGRFELDAKFGVILNSSYVQTFLANVSAGYFWSETWGFDVEGNFAINQDKQERTCIENFYNDPNYDVPAQCGDPSTIPASDPDANMGPAYVPIRELKFIFTGNFIWNPIYGKQIVLLSATNYFDFYLGMGGGIAQSDFYPQQTNFATTGGLQRGTFCTKAQQAKPAGDPAHCDLSTLPNGANPGTTDPALYGTAGRPAPKPESNPLIHLSVGQRFHFFKRFLVSGSLEDYTLLGTEAGFDNFLVITGGFGVRF